MGLSSKKMLQLLLASTALCLSAASAQAQMLANRFVAFGDSLSDNGNLFAVSGQPPAPYNMRFTNALTWVEYLAGPLNTAGANSLVGGLPLAPGNLDFAFGGSRTDTLATPGPGIATQIGGFAAFGGTFKPTDIATLWGGANDIFQGIPVAAATPATAIATMTTITNTAAANIAAEAQQLIGLGAKTIVVNNLPDFSSLPQFAGGPAAGLAAYSSSNFNSALAAKLAAVAAANPGVNIVSINAAQVFGAVIASPSLFGLTNTSQSCVAVLACVGGALSTQNQFLFWDAVHPTQTGQKIVANVVYDTLTAGTSANAGQAFALVGYNGRRAAMLGAFEQFNALPAPGGKPHYFISIIGDHFNRNAASGLAAYNATDGGLRLGAVQSLNNAMRVGLALTAVTGKGKSGDISFNPTQISADFMFGWRDGAYFANFGVGAGALSFDNYQRKLAGLPWQNTASVGGFTASSTFEAGVNVPVGSFELTPQARLAYLYARSQSYAESGVVATEQVNGRSVSGFTGALEVKATAKISDSVKVHALLGYEAMLSGSASVFNAQLIGNTALPTSLSGIKPQAAGVVYGMGLSAEMRPGMVFNASYRGSSASKNSAHQLNVGLNMTF